MGKISGAFGAMARLYDRIKQPELYVLLDHYTSEKTRLSATSQTSMPYWLHLTTGLDVLPRDFGDKKWMRNGMYYWMRTYPGPRYAMSGQGQAAVSGGNQTDVSGGNQSSSSEQPRARGPYIPGFWTALPQFLFDLGYNTNYYPMTNYFQIKMAQANSGKH